MIHLYDGIAIVRRELERDDSGRAQRSLFNKMLSLPAGDVAVWCWDGRGAKAYRQAIYPLYKSKRPPQPDGVWKTISLMKDVFRHTRALQATMDGYEADDLIGHLSRDCAPEKVLIHSIDRDLSALFNDRVSGTFEPPKGVLPSEVQLYKICVGDQSDEIKGVPGFGAKSWETLKVMGHLPALQTYIETGTLDRTMWNALSKKVQNWFCAEESWDTLRAMRDVIAFRPVTEPLKFIVGKPDFSAGDALLKEFLL
jgi:hypothetical protein